MRIRFLGFRLSPADPEISALGSHSSANFQPILNCFIRNFKLKYEDVGNIKTDCVNTVVATSHRLNIFYDRIPYGK